MRTTTTFSMLAAFGGVLAAGPAHASIGDGKPWDWDDYKSIISRNDAHQESICDSVADALGSKDLVCQIDHASWDTFLVDEHKKPFRDRKDTVTPWDCQGALNYFRSFANAGHMPESTSDDAQPVLDDMKARIKGFNCVVEMSEKPFYLDYDAKKKVMTFHITRAPNYNNGWITGELQKKFKKDFPALNKYWDDGHRP